MNSETLQVSIDRELLIRCCEKYRENATADINYLRDLMAQEAIKPRPGVFGRIVDFFSPPPKTVEEAAKYVVNTDQFVMSVAPARVKLSNTENILRLLNASNMPFVVVGPEYSFLLSYRD